MQNPDISILKRNITQFTIIKMELFKKALKEQNMLDRVE